MKSKRHEVTAAKDFFSSWVSSIAEIQSAFAAIVPPEADVSAVADAIVKVVDAPFGKRPFRVHVDPTQDGAEVVNAVCDRVRAEMLRRVGLSDLLPPRASAS